MKIILMSIYVVWTTLACAWGVSWICVAQTYEQVGFYFLKTLGLIAIPTIILSAIVILWY